MFFKTTYIIGRRNLQTQLYFYLISHENGAFQKRSSNGRNLKTPPFLLLSARKTFCVSRKQWRHDVISLSEFSSNINPKWPIIVIFLDFSGVMWRENICCVFRVKTSFSNFSQRLTAWNHKCLLKMPFCSSIDYLVQRVGCFKDTSRRAIPQLDGKSILLRGSYRHRKFAIKKCALESARRGY